MRPIHRTARRSQCKRDDYKLRKFGELCAEYMARVPLLLTPRARFSQP